MKKNLYFYALFACLCLFFVNADVSYAYTEGTYTLSTTGILTISDTWITDVSNYCSFNIYQGNYPDTTNNEGGGQNDACNFFFPSGVFDIPAIFPSLPATGTFWFVGCGGANCYMNYSTIGYYYSPLVKTGAGAWTEHGLGTAITITSPASETTITDTATTLEISYSNLDFETYPTLYVFFNDTGIGERSTAYTTTLATGTGTFSIPLSTFNFTKNTYWVASVFQYSALKSPPTLYFYSPQDDSPYYLFLDVSGLPDFYTFTNFDDWYSANVSNYEAPSDWAVGMVGFINPLLEKISEFGNRVQTYLDVSTAYQKGNDIGINFPIYQAYVLKINIFFGEFPIVQMFEWGILLMMGLFCLKMILKLLSFIPFIGGHG